MGITPLHILGLAFTATVVWLIVRFVNLPKDKRKRVFLIAAIVGIPILYPLSAGPWVVLTRSSRSPLPVY